MAVAATVGVDAVVDVVADVVVKMTRKNGSFCLASLYVYPLCAGFQ